MRSGTVAFLSGILIFLQCWALPHHYWLFLFPVVLLLAWYFPRLRLLGLVCCGFFWAMLRAEIILTDQLDKTIEGQTLAVEGQVVSLPELRTKNISFEFHITHVTTEDGKQWPSPGKVKLRWYQQFKNIKPGQYWRLQVRLKRPYGFMNPGGFDYEAWLFQHRIRATGYVVHSPDANYLLDESAYSIHRVRYFLREAIAELLHENPYQGLIFGLGLGDRSQIPLYQQKLLKETGTNHLLAISGLHIGIVAGLIYFIALHLYSRMGGLAIYFAAPRFAALAAMLVAVFYAALAGFSIPTQRALIMLAVVMLVVIRQQRHAFSYTLAIALLAVLLIDPFATMAIGFWLSFAAIFIIAYGMLGRVETNNLWWRWGRVQYLLAIGLMPLLILYFQQYPVMSFFANMVAVPWVSLFTVPFVLAGTFLVNLMPDLSAFFLLVASQALKILLSLLEWLVHVDFNLWQQANTHIWIMLFALIGSALLLQPRGLPARWLGLLWLLPLIFPYKSRPDKNEFWFTLLDVGQGLSVVIQTRHHILVYDTGAKFSNSFNAGSAVLLPYLRKQTVDKVDLLIVSHGDNDHIGGAKHLLQAFPTTPVLTSVPDRFDRKSVQSCYSGQDWAWDGVTFEILHPTKDAKARGNNSSCVLKVSNGQQSVLLSGDLEKRGEEKLLANSGQALTASILIAPHHGSKSSSTPDFIDAIDPEYVFFPVGYRNRYKFPNQDIIARYESRAIQLFDTAQHGAIMLKTDPPDMTITTYRQKAQRFWHTKF